MEAQRKNSDISDDKNMPGEMTDLTKTLDELRFKLDQTYGADELSKELEKTKAELAKNTAAKDKAEAAARDTRKQAEETQTKLNNANRAIEAQLKTISDLRREAKANAEALAKADETPAILANVGELEGLCDRPKKKIRIGKKWPRH